MRKKGAYGKHCKSERYIGNVYGTWKVISLEQEIWTPKRGFAMSTFLCRCSCGIKAVKSVASLLMAKYDAGVRGEEIRNHSTSHRSIFKKEDYIGKKYGEWTILEYVGEVIVASTGQFNRSFLCQCSCGVIQKVSLGNLQRGLSTKCNNREKHGDHIVKDKLYSLWRNIHNNCYYKKDQSYHLYGAKGIRIDPRWDSFKVFKADMGERPKDHIFSRIDLSKDFGPENCRWFSLQEIKERRRNQYLLISAEVGRRTGYTREGIRLMKKELVPFVDLDLTVNKKLVYKESVIPYLQQKHALFLSHKKKG